MSMITPVRMRLSRAKGFRLQEVSMALNGLPAVNCARPGRLGNPFTVQRALESGYLRRADDRTRRRFVVECFRDWLSGSDKWWMGEESAAARQAVLDCLPSLRDHNLACWCQLPEPGQPDHCHAACLLAAAAEEKSKDNAPWIHQEIGACSAGYAHGYDQAISDQRADGPVMSETPSAAVLGHIDAALDDAGINILPEDAAWVFAVVRAALLKEQANAAPSE